MPYFVYRVEVLGPARNLSAMGVFEAYRDAAQECRRLRREQGVERGYFKLVFAENALHAEELLSEIREPEPNIADDY